MFKKALSLILSIVLLCSVCLTTVGAAVQFEGAISEYPVVILPIFRCPPMLRTRNLLYTAVTRAARMAILVGRRDILAEMVENDRHTLRCTALAHFLTEESAK